jgi:hypothetical protein
VHAVLVNRLPQVETDQDLLADAEKEAIFAEAEFNRAVSSLRIFNIEHQQMPISFTNGEVTRIQTVVSNAQRSRLEADVRAALARRNAAWAKRAELLMVMGKIK